MTQPPRPPMPPGLDPNFGFNRVTPLITVVVVVLVGATAVRWILRGTPVGEAIAERIRMRAQRRWGGGGSGGGGGGGGAPRGGGAGGAGSPPPGGGPPPPPAPEFSRPQLPPAGGGPDGGGRG